jgi:hypothetical protein
MDTQEIGTVRYYYDSTAEEYTKCKIVSKELKTRATGTYYIYQVMGVDDTSFRKNAEWSQLFEYDSSLGYH